MVVVADLSGLRAQDALQTEAGQLLEEASKDPEMYASLDFHQEVNVVGHQAVCMDQDAMFAGGFIKSAETYRRKFRELEELIALAGHEDEMGR